MLRSLLLFTLFHFLSALAFTFLSILLYTSLSIYLYTLAVSPSLGGSRQHKRNKIMGILLCSSSNDEEPSRVWMVLLEQHIPSSPVFHNLRRFIEAITPTAPTTGLPLRQPHGNSRCQSELRHNHSPLIPIPSTFTCLPYIHPPIIQGSLYSIHPPKPRPPSSTSPVNFAFITFFSSRSLSILST